MKLYKVGTQFVMANSHTEAIAASAPFVQAQARVAAAFIAVEQHLEDAVPVPFVTGRDEGGRFVTKAQVEAQKKAVAAHDARSERVFGALAAALEAQRTAVYAPVHRSHRNRG